MYRPQSSGEIYSALLDAALDRQDAARHLIQNMLGGAAQQLVHSVGLDLAHHDHIHLMLTGEIAQCRNGVTLYEMSPVRAHTVSSG